MIVVDSNVIAYCWLNGPLTELAQQVRDKDSDWHVPILWRSEMRSVLAGYLRDGSLTQSQIVHVMDAIENALEGSEHVVASGEVFKVIEKTRLSAYDCEFIGLAFALSVPLVTSDRAVLKAFPELAMTMNAFLSA